MLSIGFDPAFIDTIVRAEDSEGKLIEKLPEPGFHHRLTSVSRVAGGNAVNIANVLNKLGIKLNLVIPSDYLFDGLLKERNLTNSYRIHDIVNETVAVIWKPGEIQFNSVIGEINSSHFTKEVYDYWQESKIQTSVNWGLNYGSLSWLSALWLSSCGWEFDEIKKLDDESLIEAGKSETNLQSAFVLEPGSVKNHPDQDALYELLQTISETSFANRYPIFSCNEEENLEYSEFEFQSKIIHTSQMITCYQNGSKQLFEVPKLENIKTFVGAGDSFLAGIIYQLYTNDRIDPSYAISVAQKYMTDTL